MAFNFCSIKIFEPLHSSTGILGWGSSPETSSISTGIPAQGTSKIFKSPKCFLYPIILDTSLNSVTHGYTVSTGQTSRQGMVSHPPQSLGPKYCCWLPRRKVRSTTKPAEPRKETTPGNPRFRREWMRTKTQRRRCIWLLCKYIYIYNNQYLQIPKYKRAYSLGRVDKSWLLRPG